MNRKENWPELLDAFIESRRNVPFEWGSQDCCLFAGAWVNEATGENVTGKWSGKYESALGALRLIGGKWEGIEAIPSEVGLIKTDPSLAQRGDIVAITQDERPCLGVCLGAVSAFAAKDGLTFKKTTEAHSAWRV